MVSGVRSCPRKIAVATDTQSITIAAAHFISPIRYGICVPEVAYPAARLAPSECIIVPMLGLSSIYFFLFDS